MSKTRQQRKVANLLWVAKRLKSEAEKETDPEVARIMQKGARIAVFKAAQIVTTIVRTNPTQKP